ncbi:MAG: tRNA preQ1(34) S-adenosylmethionine ribosyltransferase-isomerase QueA [bacterium]|nr:tRNA preQ1(34) S-adenosylmethionine ribosyltransferase-isomerase QueA [bacterium]
MLTADFNYNLPKELIAQTPLQARDHSRLMIIDKKTRTVEHRQFFDILGYLDAGDLVVWNDSKVFKARLQGAIILDEEVLDLKEKDLSDVILNAPSVEIFLVRPMENPGVWKVLAKPGKKLRLGMKIMFAEDFFAEVVLKESDGTVLLQFQDEDAVVRAKANKYGSVPTPPYVKEAEKNLGGVLSERYQTVYAKEEGSVAAPTAGFHFTPELIEKLKQKGVEFAEVTLHVGLGTFLPVKTDVVEEHRMHAEWVELSDKNAQLINMAKAEGRRVVVVGTTTVRTLEGIFKLKNKLEAYTGDINIFITPGFEFKVVDAMITNFHLPESTLIMLVSAFTGDREFLLSCYQKAVEAKYRFFSFGDAMFIK